MDEFRAVLKNPDLTHLPNTIDWVDKSPLQIIWKAKRRSETDRARS